MPQTPPAATNPAATNPAAPPPPPSDEISLRDLYLVLRRGLPLMLAVAIAAGALGVVGSWLVPDRFEAETVVGLPALPIQPGETGRVGLTLRTELTFEAYRAIAFQRATLRRALETADEADLDPETLPDAIELAAAADGPQTAVTHRVRLDDPARAARLADAWAGASLAAAETLLDEQVTSLVAITDSTAAARRGALQDAEAALRNFEIGDDSAILTGQLDSLARRIVSGEERVDAIDRLIATNDARARVLATQLGDDAVPGNPLEQLALLQVEGLIDETTAAQLRLLVGDDPDADALRLLASATLQQLTAGTAALRAERTALRAQLDGYRAQAETIRTRLADLRQRSTELSRAVVEAESAYQSVADLQPLVAYAADLGPVGGEVLLEANPPRDPVGPGTLLVGIVAAVLGGAAAVLWVLLREAVRDPDGAPAAARAGLP